MQIIKSALYIDFDNVAIPLDKNGEIGNLITHFDGLLSYLQTSSIRKEIYGTDDAIRLFSKKIVFYNPRSFGKYELIFKEYGFITIPCPVVTALNKTSTDMWLAVEMMKDVMTKNFDDYILISADVDFAPVLLYINSCGKQTVQLGVSHQNKIIQGAATISLSYDDIKTVIFKKQSDTYDASRDINNNITVKSIQLSEPVEKPSFTQAKIISTPSVENREVKEESEISIQNTREESATLAQSFLDKNTEQTKEIVKVVEQTKHDKSCKKDLTKEKECVINKKDEEEESSELEDDINEVIETYLNIPVFSPEILKEIFTVYAGCKANGIKKRFVNNTVLSRLQRSFMPEIKKGNVEYNRVLALLRFITTYLENSPIVLTPENIASEVVKNYLTSDEWKKSSSEYQITASDIRKIFKEVM